MATVRRSPHKIQPLVSSVGAARGGLLHGAARLRQSERYQLEAAIQSVHANRLFGKRRDADVLLGLYDAFLVTARSLGAAVSRASVLIEAERGRGAEALAELDALAAPDSAPWRVSRAGAGQDPIPDAKAALALPPDPALRAHLTNRFGLTSG